VVLSHRHPDQALVLCMIRCGCNVIGPPDGKRPGSNTERPLVAKVYGQTIRADPTKE